MTIPALAASGELRLLARRCPRLAGYEIHIRGVATFSGGPFPLHWLQPDTGLTRGLQRHMSKQAVGRRGALIFGHFRARLHGQSPAMAAGVASRSTQ